MSRIETTFEWNATHLLMLRDQNKTANNLAPRISHLTGGGKTRDSGNDSGNDFSSNMHMKEAQRKRFLCAFMLNYLQTKLSFRHDGSQTERDQQNCIQN